MAGGDKPTNASLCSADDGPGNKLSPLSRSLSLSFSFFCLSLPHTPPTLTVMCAETASALPLLFPSISSSSSSLWLISPFSFPFFQFPASLSNAHVYTHARMCLKSLSEKQESRAGSRMKSTTAVPLWVPRIKKKNEVLLGFLGGIYEVTLIKTGPALESSPL